MSKHDGKDAITNINTQKNCNRSTTPTPERSAEIIVVWLKQVLPARNLLNSDASHN